MPCRFMLDKHREEGFAGRMDCLPYFVAPVEPAPDPEAEKEAAVVSGFPHMIEAGIEEAQRILDR